MKITSKVQATTTLDISIHKKKELRKIKFLLIILIYILIKCMFPQSILQLSQLSLMHVCILNKYVYITSYLTNPVQDISVHLNYLPIPDTIQYVLVLLLFVSFLQFLINWLQFHYHKRNISFLIKI